MPAGSAFRARVHEDATGKVDVAFEDAGEPALKNIERPIRVFRIRLAASLSNGAPELALPGKPSIAVLPFTNMSGDPDQEYFSDGITDDIITALSRLRWFFVIARNSTFVYKGKAVDIKQVGPRIWRALRSRGKRAQERARGFASPAS
jgi:adenylate cyclase